MSGKGEKSKHPENEPSAENAEDVTDSESDIHYTELQRNISDIPVVTTTDEENRINQEAQTSTETITLTDNDEVSEYGQNITPEMVEEQVTPEGGANKITPANLTAVLNMPIIREILTSMTEITETQTLPPKRGRAKQNPEVEPPTLRRSNRVQEKNNPNITKAVHVALPPPRRQSKKKSVDSTEQRTEDLTITSPIAETNQHEVTTSTPRGEFFRSLTQPKGTVPPVVRHEVTSLAPQPSRIIPPRDETPKRQQTTETYALLKTQRRLDYEAPDLTAWGNDLARRYVPTPLLRSVTPTPLEPPMTANISIETVNYDPVLQQMITNTMSRTIQSRPASPNYSAYEIQPNNDSWVPINRTLHQTTNQPIMDNNTVALGTPMYVHQPYKGAYPFGNYIKNSLDKIQRDQDLLMASANRNSSPELWKTAQSFLANKLTPMVCTIPPVSRRQCPATITSQQATDDDSINYIEEDILQRQPEYNRQLQELHKEQHSDIPRQPIIRVEYSHNNEENDIFNMTTRENTPSPTNTLRAQTPRQVHFDNDDSEFQVSQIIPQRNTINNLLLAAAHLSHQELPLSIGGKETKYTKGGATRRQSAIPNIIRKSSDEEELDTSNDEESATYFRTKQRTIIKPMAINRSQERTVSPIIFYDTNNENEPPRTMGSQTNITQEPINIGHPIERTTGIPRVNRLIRSASAGGTITRIPSTHIMQSGMHTTGNERPPTPISPTIIDKNWGIRVTAAAGGGGGGSSSPSTSLFSGHNGGTPPNGGHPPRSSILAINSISIDEYDDTTLAAEQTEGRRVTTLKSRIRILKQRKYDQELALQTLIAQYGPINSPTLPDAIRQIMLSHEQTIEATEKHILINSNAVAGAVQLQNKHRTRLQIPPDSRYHKEIHVKELQAAVPKIIMQNQVTNFALSYEKLLTYGHLRGYSHQNYKDALKTLINDYEMLNSFKKLEHLPLAEIINNLQDTYVITKTITTYNTELENFCRNRGEPLRTAYSRFNQLLLNTEDLYPEHQRVTRKEFAVEQLLFNITGPETHKHLQKMRQHALTFGNPIPSHQYLEAAEHHENINSDAPKITVYYKQASASAIHNVAIEDQYQEIQQALQQLASNNVDQNRPAFQPETAPKFTGGNNTVQSRQKDDSQSVVRRRPICRRCGDDDPAHIWKQCTAPDSLPAQTHTATKGEIKMSKKACEKCGSFISHNWKICNGTPPSTTGTRPKNVCRWCNLGHSHNYNLCPSKPGNQGQAQPTQAVPLVTMNQPQQTQSRCNTCQGTHFHNYALCAKQQQQLKQIQTINAQEQQNWQQFPQQIQIAQNPDRINRQETPCPGCKKTHSHDRFSCMQKMLEAYQQCQQAPTLQQQFAQQEECPYCGSQAKHDHDLCAIAEASLNQ